MDEQKKKQIRNHLSHVRGYINAFYSCMDVDTEEVIEKNYLLEIIDKIEVLVADTKIIVES